jgi:hypothetical protein
MTTLLEAFHANRRVRFHRASLLHYVSMLVAAYAVVGQASGEFFLFETATLGKTGEVGGIAVSDQVLGARFYVDSPLQVEEVGGHLLGRPPGAEGHGTIFAAIVRLSGPSAFPTEAPGSLNVLAFTTFEAPFPSQDVVVPLSVSLEPGYYGLIFGGRGLFGCSGEGSMPDNNTEIPENTSFFLWSTGRANAWLSASANGARFVIKGRTAPLANPGPE